MGGGRNEGTSGVAAMPLKSVLREMGGGGEK